jgi:hypothetical protein
VTSRPKRTSPVLRGKWILDNLLCRPPPPPPPGVEGLPDTMTGTGSVRDRLEAHITNPVCASCHRVMDPLGFGLDNYDAIGAWRTEDSGFPIDASGNLGDGATFVNGREMVAHLAADPAVYRCMVEKLYTYTGRSPFRLEASDAIDALTKRFIAGGYRLPELIVDLVTSLPRRCRRHDRAAVLRVAGAAAPGARRRRRGQEAVRGVLPAVRDRHEPMDTGQRRPGMVVDDLGAARAPPQPHPGAVGAEQPPGTLGRRR